MGKGFFEAVGARVRELRVASGLTQEEFAVRAGLNPAFAGRVERGKQNLSLSTIGLVALALDVAPAALFEGVRVDPSERHALPRRVARRGTSRPADG